MNIKIHIKYSIMAYKNIIYWFCSSRKWKIDYIALLLNGWKKVEKSFLYNSPSFKSFSCPTEFRRCENKIISSFPWMTLKCIQYWVYAMRFWHQSWACPNFVCCLFTQEGILGSGEGAVNVQLRRSEGKLLMYYTSQCAVLY